MTMDDRIAIPLPLFDRLVHVSRQMSEYGEYEMTDYPEPSAYLVPFADLLEMRSIIDAIMFGRHNAQP